MPLAGLAVPLLILYRRLLFEGQAWLDLDFLLAYQPRYELLQASLRQASIPLWTDGFLGGFPIAFSEYGWFYPVNWLFLLVLPMPLAYHAEAVFGLLLAGMSAYWLGRLWGLSRLAAFLAGYLYMMGPFAFATSRFLNFADIMFALPAAAAAIENIARRKLLYVPVLAVILAVTVLAGHPQIALMLVSGAALYGLARLIVSYRQSGPRAAVALLGWLAVALLLGLAAGAPRLLPILTVTSESGRAGGLDLASASGGSAAPFSLLLGYIYPSFEIPRALGGQLRAEPFVYTGLLALPLVVLAVLGRGHDRHVRFLIALALLALVLALGSHTPAFRLLHALPLWGFFREPGRFIILLGFATAFLAAHGLEVLRAGLERHDAMVRAFARAFTWYALLLAAALTVSTVIDTPASGPIRDVTNRAIDRFLVGGRRRFVTELEFLGTFQQTRQRLQKAFTFAGWTPSITLAMAALSAVVLQARVRGRLPSGRASRAVAAVLALDVTLALGHGIDTVPAYGLQPAREVAEAVAGARGSRLLSYRGLADKWEIGVGVGDRLNPTQRLQIEYLFLRQVLAPDLHLREGLKSVDGYENLMSRRQAEILAYLGSERSTLSGFASDPKMPEEKKAEVLRQRLPVLAAFDIGSIVSGTRIDASLGPSRRQVRVDFPAAAGFNPDVWVYDVPGPAGSAFLTDRWLLDDSSPSLTQLLEKLAASPPGTVFLDSDPGFAPGELTTLDGIVKASGPASRRRFEVSAERPAVFIFNSYISKGWTATVDGRLANLYSSNRFGGAVPLQAGDHVVEFSYMPSYWFAARALAIAAAVVIAALLWAGARSVRAFRVSAAPR